MHNSKKLLLKIILIISIFVLQCCSSKNKDKTPSRRVPSGNPIQIMNKNTDAMSVKKADSNYECISKLSIY